MYSLLSTSLAYVGEVTVIDATGMRTIFKVICFIEVPEQGLVPVAVKVNMTEPADMSEAPIEYCSISKVAGEGEKVPVPDAVVHRYVAGAPLFMPVRVMVPAFSQTVWSAKFARTGFFLKFTVIVLVEVPEHGLVPVAVNVNVLDPAAMSAVLGVYCSLSEVAGEGEKVPVPDAVVHRYVAGPPLFMPVRVMVPTFSQTVWSAKFARTGFFWKYTTILSAEVLHEPEVPVAVKVNVLDPAAMSAVLGVYCSLSEVAGEGEKVPVPDVVQR